MARTRPELLTAENALVQSRKQLNFLLGRDLDAQFNAIAVETGEQEPLPTLDSVATARSRPAA